MPPALCELEGQANTASGTAGTAPRHHARGRAAAAEFTGAIGPAQSVKKAVTNLLSCKNVRCEVTALLRKPRKPASLLGSCGPAIVISGGVTDLVSQQ